MSTSTQRLGLSLSGGGYRAAAFHLGTIKKLKQLDVLEKVDVISTISGGSIIGAYYCLKKDDYAAFEESAYECLHKDNIIKWVLMSSTSIGLALMVVLFIVPAFYFLFTPWPWLFPVLITLFVIIVLRYQFYIFPVSKGIEKAYDTFFYKNAKLEDLPAHPKIVIGSTNIQTSRPFTFAKAYMGDSAYEYFKPPVIFNPSSFPISRAVMASSCVPFAFTPITIHKDFFQSPEQSSTTHPLLVDGGVYDNQGIHKLTQKGRYECSHVIISDAGGGTKGELRFRNTISLLVSTVDVFMARIKKAQMVQDIYENTASASKEIAFLSLAWDIEDCIPGFIKNLAAGHITSSVIAAQQLKTEWVEDAIKYEAEIKDYLENRVGYLKIKDSAPSPAEREIARNVGTNLTSLSKAKVDLLMKQAECLTELQVKLYCPSILNP